MLKKKKGTKSQLTPTRAKPARYALCALILLLSIAACYNLSLRLISQLHFHRANNLFIKDSFSPAADELHQADHYQPGDFKVKRGLAKVYYRLGQAEKRVKGAFSHTRKAQDFALAAARLNPFDAETAYDLALAEARLEQLYPHTLSADKNNNPYRALPYFQNTLRLRPNGVRYRFALTRYLAQLHSDQELLPAVRTLARIYPPVYSYLKKEAFWTPPVKEAAQQGFEQAVDAGIAVKEAHRALSDLWSQKGKWAQAIYHYQQSMGYRTFTITAQDYIHLGRLYLQDDRLEPAQDNFMQALNLSSTRAKVLKSIYHSYKKEGYPQELYQFLQKAGRRFILPSRADIFMARSLIDLERFNQAQRILQDLNKKEPAAEAYYWLARIAEKEKDWDSMELAIQKATVHEPGNSQYHRIFSSVLKRRKKLPRAEKEADLALKNAAKPSPWLFNHRAWIRWSRQDYQGAVRDWKRAAHLKPDRADFYARIAEGYRRTEQKALAKNYFQKALKLDPDNQGYQQKYQKLQQQLSKQPPTLKLRRAKVKSER